MIEHKTTFYDMIEQISQRTKGYRNTKEMLQFVKILNYIKYTKNINKNNLCITCTPSIISKWNTFTFNLHIDIWQYIHIK